MHSCSSGDFSGLTLLSLANSILIAAAATVTVAATVTDYQSGHVRTADEFASHLAAGTALGQLQEQLFMVYGMGYREPVY